MRVAKQFFPKLSFYFLPLFMVPLVFRVLYFCIDKERLGKKSWNCFILFQIFLTLGSPGYPGLVRLYGTWNLFSCRGEIEGLLNFFPESSPSCQHHLVTNLCSPLIWKMQLSSVFIYTCGSNSGFFILFQSSYFMLWWYVDLISRFIVCSDIW